MDNDNQLLSEYAHQGSERAFRELVRRHINMVHSAALREARGNVSLAEDITQEVFTELARCAAKLSTHPAIAGWLYTCVRRITANIRRAEDRRQRREQEAFTMNELLGPNSNDQLWLQVRPVLDDVMHELDQKDRTAVVLRFFEDLSLKEVGAALGLSENAARMRVDRALEKLHGQLSRRGIKSTASTLAVVLVAGAALSASSALAANVATGALTAAAASHSAAFTLAKFLSSARVKIAIAGAVAVLAVALVALHRGQLNHVEAKISPESTTPAVAPSLAGGAGQNNSPAGNAASTNIVIVPQMALRLVDAETAAPLPGAKLYLFYMFPDGRGKVVRASTDADGRLAVDVPQAPYHFLNMFVTADSHVPKVTTWGERRSMPLEYTMRLERGITIGGMVVDEAGNPIAGAKIEFDGPGNNMALAENIQFGPDTAAVTDANGQWSCNMIPKEYDGITLVVTDKEHAETRLSVQLKAPDANRIVVTMATGFSIKGLVQDSNGQPVKGAKIRQVHLNDEPERAEMTDASGAFEFKAMKAGELMLSVQADGYAPEVKTLQVGGNVAGLQFQLGRGWVLRGRITDEEGNPVPHAFIETTRRGIDKIKWSTNANADGRFEWNSAPQEPLLYSVLAEGFSRAYAQTLQADGSEQDIKLTRSQPEKENIQITGTAVDTATGQPLDTFKVFVSECDSDWAFPLEFYVTGKDGQFALSLGAKSNHPAYRIQIEQEGYLPAVSEKFLRTNGNQTLAFKLQKGAGPSGVVLLPNGEPAVGAAVLLCTPLAGVTLDSPAHVQSGINTTTYRTQTDSAGKFSIAPAVDPQGLIIVHDEGYAEVAPADLGAATNIVLQPWGSVKGRLMSGAQPVANKRVVARNQVLHYSDTGRRFGFVTFNFETTTDDGGNFSFDKVPPGSCKVFQEQETSGIWLESHDVSVAIKAGAVTEVALGGTGRTVVGKAILNSATGSIDWRSVPVVLQSKIDVVPAKRQDYPTTQAYIAADERYRESRQNQRQFGVLCGRDGSFQLSDVPAGTYEMNIEICDSGQDSVVPQDISQPKPVLGSVVREVTVPDDGSTEPLDLGILELTPRQNSASVQ